MNRILLSTAMLFVATSALADTPGVPANTDPAAVKAGTYTVETSHTRTQFTVSHMGFTDWYGDFTDTSGSLSIDPKNIAATKVDITIPVSSVSTTNAKLDEELKSAAVVRCGAISDDPLRFDENRPYRRKGCRDQRQPDLSWRHQAGWWCLPQPSMVPASTR